ncbi:adenylyl-sulfate kinase [Limobrevibacterium gyesilva]|uniref:Multifunctional fusion protein n=1 Tax=Limobrevibacterium gyesilva TaxID=2991712 RepID=A0AA42CFU6_9PROT|nr:adenylyl-sulfate kinase [Limobrevibacterium gyesilva]MCW3477049.1 adenylyl-sulfate kinase [Limobrevibacterium gyesilva]
MDAGLLTNAGLDAFLAQQARIGLLRFLTCGSVDDGKSTLIGRLLHEAGQILDDQLTALERDSARHGTTGTDVDFALLVDGLEAERTQGITIDVAYRFFATDRRRFMVADTPGHVQYTRNMATGAANAELAVLLVDARNGLLTQTRRHAFLVSMMGIRHVVLAVNKIDLVDFSEARFNEIRAAFEHAVRDLGFAAVTAIPISARFGHNITVPSAQTPWYDGPALLDHLESVDVADPRPRPFRMPVQWVNRADAEFRGYAGTVACGSVRPGDQVTVARSGVAATVARVVTMDGDLEQAGAGDAVTLTLQEQVDISRGDVLAGGVPVPVTDRFDANMVWLSEAPLFQGRGYLLKLGTATVAANITRIRHRIDIDSYEHVPADTLNMNDVAHVTVALGAPLALERYADDKDLGGFVLIDRLTNATVAVGMIDSVSAAAGGVIWQKQEVDKASRAALKGQRPATIWFTGLSGAGKSTIANIVEQKLHALDRHTAMLDGDNVRHGLNRDLGFTEADRIENIRRAAEAAKLMVEAGLIVLVSFISPYRSDRDAARERFEDGEFIEVFVDTPVAECRRRDPKGLYKRADAGQIRNFTGVDAPYEAPETPELRLVTTDASAERLADQVIDALRGRGIIPR